MQTIFESKKAELLLKLDRTNELVEMLKQSIGAAEMNQYFDASNFKDFESTLDDVNGKLYWYMD